MALPSTTLAGPARLTSTVSGAASSLRVATPLAAAFAVVPPVTVAVSVKVSPESAMASSVVATRTCTDRLPAAIVTPAPVTGCHALPSNHSSAVPVSTPTVALPLASDGVNVVAVALALDRPTVKTAKPPSTTAVSDTVIDGVPSLSSSVVLTLFAPPLICRFSKLPPVADTRLTPNDSLPSASASSSVAMLKLVLEAPAAMVTVATPLKSLPSAAVPE